MSWLARVGDSQVTLVHSWERLDVEVAALPSVACSFLRPFELREPVWPFTFQLEVEAAPGVAPEHAADDDLPEAARAAVTRIRRQAAVLIDRAEEYTPVSKDLYIVEQVEARYLPDALGGYRALPANLRSAPITPDGRSGQQVLLHELELMETRLVAIANELDQRKGDAAVVQERFLEEQLGGSVDA